MSIVEKALKRLQEQHKTPSDARPVSVSTETVASQAVIDAPKPEAVAPGRDKPVERRKAPVSVQELRSAGMLPSISQERRLANEYRQVKRRLLANAFGRGTERIAKGTIMVVASALPGEGKTFTSINLATSLAADHDVSVVLVDADVAKPHISQLFGVGKEKGMLDALKNEQLDVEQLLLDTPFPRLSVLPVGHGELASAAELVVSARMEQLMSRLAHAFPGRIVLIDSAPILSTSESRALTNVAGQIVLVVRAGATLQQAVLDALEYLEEDKFVGVVLNQGSPGSLNEYYGYGGHGEPESQLRASG